MEVTEESELEINTLKPKQNGHDLDNIFKIILFKQKKLHFDSNFDDFCSWRTNGQLPNHYLNHYRYFTRSQLTYSNIIVFGYEICVIVIEFQCGMFFSNLIEY